MKYIRLMVVIVAVIFFALDAVVAVSIVFSMGMLGNPEVYGLPFIPVVFFGILIGIILLGVYVRGFFYRPTFSFDEVVAIILLLAVTILPWLMAREVSKQSKEEYEQYHAAYNATCRPVTLDQYQYSYCAGQPGVNPGVKIIKPDCSLSWSNECIAAMKVWDSKGWVLMR